jgi:CrcB protein
MRAFDVLCVFVAGGLGSSARFAVSSLLLARFGAAFPYGTLAVNLLGSFALGALVHASLASAHVPPVLRLALATGFLGGFTTYSAFSQETFEYLHAGALGAATLYVALTLAGGLVASALGWLSARAVLG